MSVSLDFIARAFRRNKYRSKKLRNSEKEKYRDIWNKIVSTNYEVFFECSVSDGDVLEKYWLNKPFAMAVICNNKLTRYEVLEPKLNHEEFQVLEGAHSSIRDRIILKSRKDLEKKRNLLFDEVVGHLRKINSNLSLQSIGKIWYYLSREFIGYGKIDAVLKDRYIEDISCSGYNLPVYVYHRAYGSMPTNIVFDESELDSFVLRLSQKANVQVSIENPLADAALPTGERLQITYRSVVSTRGPSFTVRKFSNEAITPLDLISWNSVSAEVMAFLWLCIECKKNLLIIGSTASGKTTMLNAVSLFIPYVSKIISIEDTREVRLPHENWLPLLAKSGKEMFELLKACLRQRPEYILVGEIRGREAITLFQAMNTGHTTYSTLHAGDISSAINRLVHEPINVPIQMFDSLNLVMLLGIEYTGGRAVRRMQDLYDVYLDENYRVVYNPVFIRDRKKDAFTWRGSQLIDDVAKQYGVNRREVMKEIKRRAGFLDDLKAMRCRMKEFVEKINDYRVEFYENL